MRIKEVSSYGAKFGWRCEDSSSVNVAERSHSTPNYWEIKGERDNDYCQRNSWTSWRDSKTLVIDKESDAQGNDIWWLHSADSDWGDPSELYQCEYECWEEAERMLKEGTFKRVVNYTMGIGHFVDMLNDLNEEIDESIERL